MVYDIGNICFRKKKSKKKAKTPPPSSSSSSSEDSSSDSSGSSDSSSDSSSENEDSGGKKKKSKKKKKGLSNFEKIATIFPYSERPPELKNKDIVNKMSMNEIEAMFNMTKSREKSLGAQKLFQAVNSDVKHPKIKFKSAKDNCTTKLHPARFLRKPITSPDQWAKDMPIQRTPVIRQLPLEFTGTHDQVAERTIEILHDRSKAPTLKEFYSGNAEVVARSSKEGAIEGLDLDWKSPKTLKAVQDALVNYLAANH